MRLFALSIFLAAAARASTAGVLVVAANGSGNFLDLQPAVDAAQDGDVILVRSGTYGTFAIVGTIPASGALTWTSSVPADLGPGLASRNVHFQAVCVDAAGTRFLTGARVLVELDQAW